MRIARAEEGSIMTAPHPPEPQTEQPAGAGLIRAAIWVAIGALIAAAFVCVVWVFVGSANGIIGRAFLTLLLLAGFAGVALLDAHLAPRRPAWFALSSMGVWVITLLLGATMIWMPERFFSSGLGRFVQFLLIVLVLQLAFVPALVVTKTGPQFATLLLPHYIYQNAFEYLRFGYAAAMSGVLVLTVLGLLAAQFWLLRRWLRAAA